MLGNHIQSSVDADSNDYSNTTVSNSSFVWSMLTVTGCPGWSPPGHIYFQLANMFFLFSYLAPNRLFGILYLRCTMLVGCAFISLWGAAVQCSYDTLIWNSLFVVINFIHICAIVYQIGPLKFPKEIEEVKFIFYYMIFLSIYSSVIFLKIMLVIISYNCH